MNTNFLGGPVRRLVTVDDRQGRSWALSDGVVDSVGLDPVRPGFSSVQVWQTECTPATAAIPSSLDVSHRLTPAQGGSICRIVTVPPDTAWNSGITPDQVQAYFASVGAAGAWRHDPSAPHAYMQQTQTRDFCVVLKGEVTLILDTSQVALCAGDTVVQRGTRHAWSNRSAVAAVIAISSHDASPLSI